MHDIDQLIEQARALMACPSCGRHFESEEIRLKGYMEHTYILQAVCSHNHAAVSTTWISSSAPTLYNEMTPLQDDHVLALHEALQAFDGDFKTLWSKKGT